MAADDWNINFELNVCTGTHFLARKHNEHSWVHPSERERERSVHINPLAWQKRVV
jgi:hypothetical protein